MVRRRPVVSALVAALVIRAGAYAAPSATGSADPALEPAPAGRVAPEPAADGDRSRDIAAEAAAEAGQGVEPDSVRRLVPPSPASMIVDPSGTAVVWSGCRRGPVTHVDRCNGRGTPDGLLILTGRAAPGVREVRVAGPRLPATPAVPGDGGWLWVGAGFGPEAAGGRGAGGRRPHGRRGDRPRPGRHRLTRGCTRGRPAT